MEAYADAEAIRWLLPLAQILQRTAQLNSDRSGHLRSIGNSDRAPFKTMVILLFESRAFPLAPLVSKVAPDGGKSTTIVMLMLITLASPLAPFV